MNTLNIEKRSYVNAFIKQTFSDFKKYWKTLIPAFLVIFIIAFASQSIFGDTNVTATVITQIILAYLSLGLAKMLLNIVDNKEFSLKQIFTSISLIAG